MPFIGEERLYLDIEVRIIEQKDNKINHLYYSYRIFNVYKI